jgi:hypothetical protein
LKKLWYKISYLGTPTAVDSQELQSAVLTNCISLIGALLMPMLGILYRLDLNFLNTELDKQKSESNNQKATKQMSCVIINKRGYG